jgi:hypothetical protein
VCCLYYLILTTQRYRTWITSINAKVIFFEYKYRVTVLPLIKGIAVVQTRLEKAEKARFVASKHLQYFIFAIASAVATPPLLVTCFSLPRLLTVTPFSPLPALTATASHCHRSGYFNNILQQRDGLQCELRAPL